MADDSTGKVGDSAAAALSGLTRGSGRNAQIGKDEFLQLLVTQLKNQDPMDPMKSEEFAVNLAQFSQLEQLVSINEKLGESSSQDLSSLAAYLGHEVILGGDKINVANGTGGHLRVDLPTDVRSLNVEIIDDQGKVRDVLRFGEIPAGKHTLNLEGVEARPGSYSYRVSAVGVTGGEFDAEASPAGVVTGFVPGPEPKLIINGQEVSPSEVTEVTLAPQSGQ